MDIHKPKASHSWREFLIEIGTIICGILIALGLEQVAEWAHWQEKAHAARTSIHKELTRAYVLAEERIAQRDCANAYLDQLAADVESSPAVWRPRNTAWCGIATVFHYRSIGGRPWPTEVWRSIEAEGVVSHFGEDYRAKAPFIFNFIDTIRAMGVEEMYLAPELDPLRRPLVLTPDGKLRLLSTIARLRRLNINLALTSRQLQAEIARLDPPGAAELEADRAAIPNFLSRAGTMLNPQPTPAPRS